MGFNPQASRVQDPTINEEIIFFGDFVNPSIVENQSSIVYLSYDHSNFQLRSDVINLFSNTTSFYGRITKNVHSHVVGFMEISSNFKYEGMSMEAILMRFLCTL